MEGKIKYREWTLEQKQAVVRLFYANERRWSDTARKAGISDGLLRYWLADEDINPDKDYAKKLRSRLKVKLAEKKAPTDPLPNGVEMASVNNPDELLRENKDLRKKIAYLEDKVAYLTELYKVTSEEPEKILKKRFIALRRLVQTGYKSIRRLCIIAEVSPKCLYAHLKGPSDKEISDESIMMCIKQVQQEYGNSIGYCKMQDRLQDDYGIKAGRKKILRLMKASESLSAVRRKHFTEEYYVRRREMKDNAPKDLIGRNFFALEPFKRFVCDITYLTGCDETWYLSVIEDPTRAVNFT